MLSFLKKKEPEIDYRQVWMSYSQALQEQQYDYEQELASAQARLSASGVAQGSEKWQQGLSAVEKKYQDISAKMQNTKAHRLLQDQFETMQSMAGHGERLARMGLFDTEGGEQSVSPGMWGLGIGNRAQKRMDRATQYARDRYAQENPDMPRREDFETRREWADARRAMPKFEVTLQDYFESQYGQADITGYEGRAAAAQAEGGPTAEQQAAAQRARRGAAGGTSPWW